MTPPFKIKNTANDYFLMRETMVIKSFVSCDNFHAVDQIFQTSLIQTRQLFQKITPGIVSNDVLFFT